MSVSEGPGDCSVRSEDPETSASQQLTPALPTTPPGAEGQSDIDVAPLRKTRKRPEHKPPAEPAEISANPKSEDDSPKASPQSAVSQGGWGYWGSWGKSIISTASATVASVGQGISHAIEKAETSLGIPSPEGLSAQVDKEEKEDVDAASGEQERQDGTAAAGGAMGVFSSLSSLSSVVQSTGKTVITGGLDALEFIGKKTMDVIAEGDPGFKRTKGLMIRTSTLSQVLREAKEQEEKQTAEAESSDMDKKAHYGMLFDQFHGLSHLEALEILSRESQAKVKSVLTTMSGPELALLKKELALIKDTFSLVEFDEEEGDEGKDVDGAEFVKELTDALAELHIPTTADKLGKARKNACERIAEVSTCAEEKGDAEEKPDGDAEETPDGDAEETPGVAEVLKKCSVEEVHFSAITSLAELTARSIEQFHKAAELIQLCDSQDVSAVERAKTLSHITIVLCKEISLLSKQFTSCLTSVGSNEKGDVLNPLITGVFLEASNSASYIQDAFQLLLPVLEVSHIQKKSDRVQQ